MRLSDEVLEIVEGYRGNGFNEKFENLCIDFLKGREKMENDKKLLQQHIDDKYQEMKNIQGRILKLRSIEPKASALVNEIASLINM